MKTLVVTKIDEFFAIVRNKGEISVEEVSFIMQREVELVERWAKALKEAGMVSLHYPMVHTKNGKVRVRYKNDKINYNHGAHLHQPFLAPAYARL